MASPGLQAQIWHNNRTSLLLLIAFPALLLSLLWAVLAFAVRTDDGLPVIRAVNEAWLQVAPYVCGLILIWFMIAWGLHSYLLRKATAARSLARTENPRVYNLLENLCISRGLAMPKLQIIDDSSLNAYSSGLGPSTFAITISQGLLDTLEDLELEAVLAHELTHIRNRDVRLMVISVIFVGIFAFLAEMAMRTGSRPSGNSKNGKGTALAVIVLILLSYWISIMLRFAISRKREFLADAGAVELTKNAPALASALRKVAEDPYIEAVKNDDVAQLFIHHPRVVQPKPNFLTRVFATHPPIEDRIRILESW